MKVNEMKIHITDFLCLVAIITIILFLVDLPVRADQVSENISGRLYELEEKNEYDYSSKTVYGTITSTGSQFGSFCLKGNLEKVSDVNGFSAYEVTEGNAQFYYSPTGPLVSAGEDDWHIIEDKSSEVMGEKIDNKILGGAILVQTSKEGSKGGEKWLTDIVKTNITSKDAGYKEDFYEANEIQQVNGCFYRIIVVYEVERKKTEKKLFSADKERKKYIETYEFYLKDTSEAKIAAGKHPNTKKVVADRSNVVNTGKDNGFSGAESFKDKDPHYGWQLGSFILKGYTSTANYEGEEVFLKNKGDAISLNFNLEEDITKLNGKENLSIAEDKNGSDQIFQVEKTNFKHGALIILHTDYEGKKSRPILYTDFLAAYARTGADTRVQLFEEGDYEVALDYEIKDSSGIDSYTDYRMSFSFKIRNGRSMVYAFNNISKSQIESGDLASGGFTLNTANSHYLDINVLPYKLQNEGGGKKRLISQGTRPASDGESFTEEGVYKVTVDNRYQSGEDDPLYFYVGSDPYIIALYKAGDDPFEALNGINEKIQAGYTLENNGNLNPPKPKEEKVEKADNDIEETTNSEDEEAESIDDSSQIEQENTTITKNEEESREIEETEENEDFVEAEQNENKSNTALIIVFLAIICSCMGLIIVKKRGAK
ncbi:MAG: hypothetical protein K5930_02530 [Treponemataceae bacterium]|nr:hypothetical protein [Treponemataceae bacterium]